MSATVCIQGIRAPLFAAAACTGRPMPALARAIDVSPGVIADGTVRLPHEVVSRAWDALAGLAGEESFGVVAAELLDGAPFDFVDYALRHHASVGELSRAFARWQRLFHTANDARSECSPDGDEVVWIHRLEGDPPTSRHMREFILGTWLMRLRRWTGARLLPRAVGFQHPAPADCERATRFFGVTPTYGDVRTAIVMPTEALHVPVSGADPELRALFESRIEQAQARSDGDDGFIESVRAEIRRGLAHGSAELGAVARRLAMSARTLQRRLADCSTSFNALLDEERHEVAVERLRRSDSTVTEVAFLLGFSDTSAFSRAFRRWTGTTPSGFRGRVA